MQNFGAFLHMTYPFCCYNVHTVSCFFTVSNEHRYSLQINQYLEEHYTLGTGALEGNRESTLNNEQVVKINGFHLII